MGGELSDEQSAREAQLVERVIASFDGAPDARLQQLMQALTRHLHAFLREVRLTEREWQLGIDFLTGVGHITDDRRQEFVLLSDVLGASMQTVAINNEAYGEATEATVFGPFFVENAPHVELGGDIAGGAPRGRAVLEWTGRPVTDADWKPTVARSQDRNLGGGCGWLLRRTVRRSPDCCAERHLEAGQAGLVFLLGHHADALPDSRRWTGRRHARRRRQIADAGAPLAFHGQFSRLSYSGHPHLRTWWRLPRQ